MMKALYIIAWVCLVLSVAVHVLSMTGPEDVFSDLDAFVWILHGGAIILGFPVVLCLQKLTSGTKDKDLWKDVFQYCPLWMGRMVGFFFLYGIINFVWFMSKNESASSSHGTPAGIFKGFSGHWMIFYSIELAVFYSCLKKKISIFPKSFKSDQFVSMGEDSGQQNSLSVNPPRELLRKYSSTLMLFVIAVVCFLFLVWLFFKGYPWFLAAAIFSFFPFVIVQVVYLAYSGLRLHLYLKHNHFEIWKLGKSNSLADRLESQRQIKELDDPHLKSLEIKATRFSEICFWVWLITLVLIFMGLTFLHATQMV